MFPQLNLETAGDRAVPESISETQREISTFCQGKETETQIPWQRMAGSHYPVLTHLVNGWQPVSLVSEIATS